MVFPETSRRQVLTLCVLLCAFVTGCPSPEGAQGDAVETGRLELVLDTAPGHLDVSAWSSAWLERVRPRLTQQGDHWIATMDGLPAGDDWQLQVRGAGRALTVAPLTIQTDQTAFLALTLSATGPGPRVSALAASARVVKPGTVVVLGVWAEDEDGGKLRYAWRADGGTFVSAHGPRPTWVAPKEPGVYGVFVQVQDSRDESREAQVAITVSDETTVTMGARVVPKHFAPT